MLNLCLLLFERQLLNPWFMLNKCIYMDELWTFYWTIPFTTWGVLLTPKKQNSNIESLNKWDIVLSIRREPSSWSQYVLFVLFYTKCPYNQNDLNHSNIKIINEREIIYCFHIEKSPVGSTQKKQKIILEVIQ